MIIFWLTGILCFVITIVCILLKVRKSIYYVLLRLIITIGLIIGIFAPLNGYETALKFVKEIKILPIEDNIYYTKLSDNSYIYWVRESPIIKEEGEKEVQELKKKIVRGNISIIHDKNCTEAVLRVYEGKGKPSDLSFAFLAKKNRYEFIIPEYNPDTENNQ